MWKTFFLSVKLKVNTFYAQDPTFFLIGYQIDISNQSEFSYHPDWPDFFFFIQSPKAASFKTN